MKRRRSLQHNHHDKDHFRHHNKRHTSASFCSVALEDLDFSHLEHTVTDVSFTTILNNERNANGMMKNDSFNSTTKRGSEVCISLANTVDPFNSCTSRPDACKRLVAQTPTDNMSKHLPSKSTTHVACESKLSSVVK